MWSTTLLFFLFAALFLGLASFSADRSDQRLRSRIERVRGGTGSQAVNRQASVATSVRRQQSRTMLGGLGQQLSVLLPRSEELRRQLEQAGIGLNVIDYVLLCLAAGIVTGGLAHFAYGLSAYLCVGAALCVTLGLPHLLLRRRIARRRQQFVAQFPDAIDLIVRAVKSGLPVTESLQTVADELPNQVGQLFQEITGNIKLGKTLDEALVAASHKVQVPELRFFVISIAIQQETGGNLAEILQNLVNLMRRRLQVKLKIRALSSEARASAMIIGALPFVMFGIIYLVDSDYVMKLFTDPKGWLLLIAGLTSLSLGAGIMAKMVRFEI